MTPAEKPSSSLRVLVADDHPIYRAGIVRALGHAGERVVAEACDGNVALARLRRLQPDVALLDVRMPGLDGLDVLRALVRTGPDVPVVLLSAFGDEPIIRAGLEAGAAAYLTKDADRRVVVQAARVAAEPANAPRLLAGRAPDLLATSHHCWLPRLTVRDRDVLLLARAGSDLDESQLVSAIAKLGAGTLPEALEIASQAGIVGRT